MAQKKMINEIVIDLYCFQERLYSLEEQMEDYEDPQFWPDDFNRLVVDASNSVEALEQQVAKALGVEEMEKQLNYLRKNIGIT